MKSPTDRISVRENIKDDRIRTMGHHYGPWISAFQYSIFLVSLGIHGDRPMMLEFHERVGQNLKWNINYTSSKFKGDLSMDVNSSLRR